jgi:myb proto-oncogene protein
MSNKYDIDRLSSYSFYADMGSLSLAPNNGVASSAAAVSSSQESNLSKNSEVENGRACWGGFHSITRSFEEHHSSDAEGSDGFGQNNVNLNDKKSKLCARGHWRPAEDTKLKELVALYGPQNWNLIAEKLEGRSGNYKVSQKSLFFFFFFFFFGGGGVKKILNF